MEHISKDCSEEKASRYVSRSLHPTLPRDAVRLNEKRMPPVQARPNSVGMVFCLAFVAAILDGEKV